MPYSALHLPAFPLEALLRLQPELRHRPCAVIDPARNSHRSRARAPLLAANHHAATTGIQPGWPATRALARCPALTLLDRSSAAEADARAALLALARTLAPRFELTAPDTLTLDLTSIPAARHSPADWSTRTLESLVPLGLPVRLAIATDPDIARLATCSPTTAATLDFDGPEPAATPAATPPPVTPADLHHLPLSLLASFQLEPENLNLFAQLGLATIGHFARLPPHDLAARLSPRAATLHALLHHPPQRPLQLAQNPEKFLQVVDIEYSLTSSSLLVFHCKRLLHGLAASLAARDRVATALRLALWLDGGGVVRRELRLPEPTRREEWLLRPVEAWLEDVALSAPVVGIELEAAPQQPGAAAQDLFERGVADPHRLAHTIARLEGLLGPDAVGVPVRADSHRPDAFRLLPFAVGTPPPATTEPAAAVPPPALPLRRLRPPLTVMVAAEPHRRLPRPLALLGGPHRGRIRRSRGPFPLSGAWWEPLDAWQSAEWDVETETGRLLRLAFTPPDNWQLEGEY